MYNPSWQPVVPALSDTPMLKTTPGPGAYRPAESAAKKPAVFHVEDRDARYKYLQPGFIKGTSKRFECPGPGTYNLREPVAKNRPRNSSITFGLSGRSPVAIHYT